jgi:replicative DNA helicase
MIQLQVLNKILKDKDSSFITLNNLTEDYFSEYVDEFNFIKSHLERYGNIPDSESFLNKFSDFEIINVEEKNSYLISELTADKNTRNLANVFNKIRTLLMDNKTDEAMNLFKDSSSNLSTGVALQCVDILRDTSRYEAYVERTKDFQKFYIKTGFEELDAIMGGWDREEELGTIVARTNYGKSWILLKSAAKAAEQGLRVGIYSGEMSEKKVGYRLDTLIGHLSNGSITHGNIAVQNDYKRFIDELPNRFTGSIKVLTPTMIDGPGGVNSLRTFIEKEKLDILFVDQHSLLEDDRKAKNPIEKAANISKDLKNLQVMKKIPIISVSQQNRTVNESGKVDTTQIAQSDRIGQDSTVIIFLEKKEDIIKLTLVKSRDSENGKSLSYRVDFNRGMFIYIPESEESEVQSSKDNQEDDEYQERYEPTPTGKEVF